MVLVKHGMEQISETYDGIPMPSKEQEDIAEAQNISLPFACSACAAQVFDKMFVPDR
ncbi:hypothetical protein HanXRQr2_Chr04g0152981 [Helianthus annuus]|uniref:Uncharacterized protein n=1 Tax=Helianthus annuus TaxID=4232 RepID=A0A251TPF3_HELAN|nr:hypothetical protein HanXRQr2_Chr04g0152981 [Helianthus annuus]KAJ0930262.1 hypothetical protein HanPSC8_Chr04g0147321 [Helianthus annuus]